MVLALVIDALHRKVGADPFSPQSSEDTRGYARPIRHAQNAQEGQPVVT